MSAALIRHAVARDLADCGRPVAADLAARAETPAEWALLGREAATLGPRQSGTYGRRVLADVCEAMAGGRVDAAVERMADDCGMTSGAWADDEQELLDAAPVEVRA